MSFPYFARVATCVNCPRSSLKDGAPFCEMTGAPIPFWEPEAKCPEEQWGTTFVYGHTPPKGKPTPSIWERATAALDKLLELPGMGIEAATTLTSEFMAADDPRVLARQEACRACPFRKDVGDKSYCAGGCGCPQTRVSELGVKLRFKALRCPKVRFPAGDANAAP